MAENNIFQPVWVDANTSIGWWYTFHDNRAAQYAMANCLSPDGQLMTTEQGVQLNDDQTAIYFVNFFNNGPRNCYHNLNIGGLT